MSVVANDLAAQRLRVVGPQTGGRNPDDELDDTGNALRFAEDHAGKILSVYKWRAFLLWDERVWAENSHGAPVELAKQTARRLLEEAELERDDTQRKRLMRHAHSSAEPERVCVICGAGVTGCAATRARALPGVVGRPRASGPFSGARRPTEGLRREFHHQPSEACKSGNPCPRALELAVLPASQVVRPSGRELSWQTAPPAQTERG